ncbi:MAG: type II toxin-antitoxin system RelE/ParE family toxin [Ignavibacteria bacterium]|nr:type II toxin-antitoxin system RelE/ParE family toxin [Ignavibacteria bacterium]
MNSKFNVLFLKEAKDFLESIDVISRDKILFNIRKAQLFNDPGLFKKLTEDIWEFRTIYNKTYYRLFAFWDKTNKENILVVNTHGLIKKTSKTPKAEIEHAETLRKEYFNLK